MLHCRTCRLAHVYIHRGAFDAMAVGQFVNRAVTTLGLSLSLRFNRPCLCGKCRGAGKQECRKRGGENCCRFHFTFPMSAFALDCRLILRFHGAPGAYVASPAAAMLLSRGELDEEAACALVNAGVSLDVHEIALAGRRSYDIVVRNRGEQQRRNNGLRGCFDKFGGGLTFLGSRDCFVIRCAPGVVDPREARAAHACSFHRAACGLLHLRAHLRCARCSHAAAGERSPKKARRK